MKKKDIFTYLDEKENKNEQLKKWGDLYRIEKDIINVIVNTRKEKKMSQQDIANLTGLKQPAIARIENQVNSPQLDTLIKILDALDIKITLEASCNNDKQIDPETHRALADELQILYSKEYSQPSYTETYPGGIKYENKSDQYSCNENNLT